MNKMDETDFKKNDVKTTLFSCYFCSADLFDEFGILSTTSRRGLRGVGCTRPFILLAETLSALTKGEVKGHSCDEFFTTTAGSEASGHQQPL